jgi:glycosyltransferase involved in cell wall biosynthesis
MLNVSVIVCAYTEDRWDDIVSSISSLKSQSYPPKQIILTIDHNQQLFERACQQFPDIQVIQNQEERGLSGARNTSIRVASGDIIAFMDEDAVASPDWLFHLVEKFKEPSVMGVGGAINPNWENGRPKWFPQEFDWVVGCTYLGLPEQAAPVRNLIGCNMSFRREVFEGVGVFRNGIGRVGTIPVGCEETEICIRARQKWPEQNFIFEPLARVLHRVPEKRKLFSYFTSRCYGEGISKALISRFVGAKDSTNSEWAYTLRTLPRGILRGMNDLLHGKLAGLQQALVIMIGLAITTAGFLMGKISNSKIDARSAPLLERNLSQG